MPRTLQKPRDPYRSAIESQPWRGARPTIVHEPELRQVQQYLENLIGTSSGGGAPAAHKITHQDGGTDEINVQGLTGVLADGQIAAALLTLTGQVIVATAAAPSAGQALVAIDATSASWQSAPAPGAHHETHENGGGDEITVEGLSGLLADAQTPLAHTHTQSDISDLQVIPGITYATGNLTIADGAFRVMAEQIILGASDVLTVQGNGCLRIV